MLHVTVLQVVAVLIAFLAQFSRIFAATKPFWGKLPAVVQVWLPPLLPCAAALQAQLAGVASWTDLTVALIVSAALLMPGAPSNRSSAPLRAAQPFKPPPMALLMLCFACFALCACAAIDAAWPVVESCPPSESTLLTQVETILLSGGDYESKLRAAAQQLGADGKTLVECAIKEFIGAAGPNTPDQAAAKARGRAFLAKVTK